MLALFLTEAAVGSLMVLLLVPPRAAGRGFCRFAVAMIAVLLLLGTAAGYAGGGRSGIALALFATALPLLVASAGLFHVGRFGTGRVLLAAALLPALPGVIADTVVLAPDASGAGMKLLYGADAVSAGLVPGAVLIAMVLGHYYLNVPGLSIRHLQRLAVTLMAAIALRAVVLGISVAIHREVLGPLVGVLLDTTGRALPVGTIDPFVMVFVLIQVAFGVIVPGAFAIMAWRTSLIASTQSTTGILYVALIMVIMGEMSGRYVLTLTRLPL